MIFQIVAVFVTDTEFDYVRPEFETKKERTEYLETVARKNLFAIDGAAIEAGDKLLTLSMCCTLYGKNETGDQRLVVAAKLLPTAAKIPVGSFAACQKHPFSKSAGQVLFLVLRMSC